MQWFQAFYSCASPECENSSGFKVLNSFLAVIAMRFSLLHATQFLCQQQHDSWDSTKWQVTPSFTSRSSRTQTYRLACTNPFIVCWEEPVSLFSLSYCYRYTCVSEINVWLWLYWVCWLVAFIPVLPAASSLETHPALYHKKFADTWVRLRLVGKHAFSN